MQVLLPSNTPTHPVTPTPEDNGFRRWRVYFAREHMILCNVCAGQIVTGDGLSRPCSPDEPQEALATDDVTKIVPIPGSTAICDWCWAGSVAFNPSNGSHYLTHVEGRLLAEIITITWSQCDPHCPGWLHMHDPHGVERCDACNRFRDDDAAALAHDTECGCDWEDQADEVTVHE